MKKHTLGPWIGVKFKNVGSDCTEPLGDERWVLVSPTRKTPILISGVFASNPNEADSCLIAAAPELLEALKLAQDVLMEEYGPDYTHPGAEIIRNAIAKAEGT